MSQFSTQINIDAPAEEVFAFVTDFNNMSEYLPTVKKAMPAGNGQIRLQGEVNGHTYDSTGWYQTHEMNRTLLWGAKGANEYSGDLEVMAQGDKSVLTINLKFDALPEVSPEDRKKLEAHEPEIKKGLDEAGKRVKELCEQAFVPSAANNKGYVS